ncbi:MAG TPA: hypothetical protein H9727_00285 [Candidatus Borkfalkia avistercoris]|uniref:Uncharacterized protein n=1 Tax=Candidatus Borkfalkia avistercoris TaxID=2838504 RepID=A0A9D2A686_9FIRM|nr:hypothetical protein [Candidatus Borkfalkia avistercoris]
MVRKARSAQARKKALARLIAKHRADLATICWVCGALTALGVILTFTIACAALESMLGFFIGLIPIAASVITGAVATRRIRFALGEEEFAGTGAIIPPAAISSTSFFAPRSKA